MRQQSAQKRTRSYTRRQLRESLRAVVQAIVRLLARLAELQAQLHRGRAGRARPWHLKVHGSKRAAARTIDTDRLLQLHRDLKDTEMIASAAAQYQMPESDFFTDPVQVEKLLRCILADNPPWLYVARKLSGGETGADAHSQELLWREQITRSAEEMTLFVPDESWRDMPLASLTLRPTRTLDEVWKTRLIDQILPSEVLVDRHSRGELMVPRRQDVHQRLEFRPETRVVEILTRKQVPIPIDSETGSGKGGQVLYFLLDYSASMQGKSATLALAAIAAAIRANMGQRDTIYLFRRYADSADLWPRRVESPLQASTVAEKDELLRTICSTNFNGGSTHVNDALNVAAADIEALRRDRQIDAEMLLVTDGRAEILESTRLTLIRAGVKVHTVMLTAEKNPGLQAMSESFTTVDVDIDIDAAPAATGERPLVAAPVPHRAFRI